MKQPLSLVAVLACTLALSAAAAPAADGGNTAFSDEVIYFLMIDRFSDGDAANNLGDYPQAEELLALGVDEVRKYREDHGYDPKDFGYYQGGDFQGIIDKLDYIAELGATAIWVTPVFRNKTFSSDSAGYHGYWIVDFTDTDPHLGTAGQFKSLVDGAHSKGMKVYLDIVANHTADIIYFADGDYNFRTRPHPVSIAAEHLRIKKPLWLNNPAYYHNLGSALLGQPDHPFYGDSSLRGDFFGLDDLATEMPEVLDGMIEIYSEWIRRFRIDGFRIDTAKHVNMDFWQAFSPAMMKAAEECGVRNFRIFGEVSDEPGRDGKPAHGQKFLSQFVYAGAMPSVLDFGFSLAANDYAVYGASPGRLADFFADDAWFVTDGTSAHDLPTFLGNHDFGRIGFRIVERHPDASKQWSRRSVLGHALMFFARGVPTVYYGDEQGFTGGGNGTDKQARQCMFANQLRQFLGQENIASDNPQGNDQFNTQSALFKAIQELSRLRREHPALRRGTQITRLADDESGVFAFSRVLFDEAVEYVAVFNNSTAAAPANVPTASPGTGFRPIYPCSDDVLESDASGILSVRIPGLSAQLYRAVSAIPKRDAEPTLSLNVPQSGGEGPRHIQEAGFSYAERLSLVADVRDSLPGRVRFFRIDSLGERIFLGENGNPPYAIFLDPSLFRTGDGAFVAEYENIHGTRCENMVSCPQ